MRQAFSFYRDAFRIAYQSILEHKLRAFLTLIGIIIGVAAVVLALCKQVQLQAVLGLQVDDQGVAHVAGCVVNGVRCGPEIHFNVGVAPGQAFASADVKRHTGPAPVGYFGAQRHKSFGIAGG